MFLRYTTRKKNGKEPRYYSLVENRRGTGGRGGQRHALYLGEINDRQQEAGRKTIEIFEEGQTCPRTVALFPEERCGPVADPDIVRIRLRQLSLPRPWQWGAGWLAVQLWEQVGRDRFWAARLPPSRKGPRWDYVLPILVPYRLVDPGSEWRWYRHWFEHRALADLLGADLTVAAETAELSCTLDQDKVRQACQREGRYLLRSHITRGRATAELWPFHIQLTEVEAAFKNLKGDLALRPIYHQLEHRIEAPIFISFLAYCLQVTLRRRWRALAPGLTPHPTMLVQIEQVRGS